MPSFGSETESRLKRSRALLRGRQDELKYRAAGFIRLCPQPSPVTVDDGSADRQPHPDSAGLRGEESLKNTLDVLWVDARSGIAHCHEDVARLILFSAIAFNCNKSS